MTQPGVALECTLLLLLLLQLLVPGQILIFVAVISQVLSEVQHSQLLIIHTFFN